MPRQSKSASNVDVSKLRDIEEYTHDDKKRTNNPPVGMAQHDKLAEAATKYQFDPHLDPTLEWTGKTEGMSFEVPTSSIHIHESIKPHSILSAVQAIGENDEAFTGQVQMSMFDDPLDRMRRRQAAIQFYQHGVDWTNRMIAGDSLVVMNSLLQKEGMAGQVQMVYIDPPYGIKYGSNFQPFVDKRDVKQKDEDLSQEPEMIKAFRDTWELGIHSYLTYLRNRLLLARELLADSGCVFLQINSENAHTVTCLLDEIFGPDNFVADIVFRKKSLPLGASFLETMHDHIIFYAKNKPQLKFHHLYTENDVAQIMSHGPYVLFPDNTWKKIAPQEFKSPLHPIGSKYFRLFSLIAPSFSQSGVFNYHFEGKDYPPPSRGAWVCSKEKLDVLAGLNRLQVEGNSLSYRLFYDDFPYKKITNMWDDMIGAHDKIYVVQTSTKAIQRCMLMVTDPGDLVLDITCGSGTTAYVAEQWGRRWITCDTSRVAITLAKQRLMTATFDYYKLAHEEQGVGSGFVYKKVPHISLKSIVNNEPMPFETMYDQPEIDKTKVRITGPFTVEALPAPVVKPLDELADMPEDASAKQSDWRDQLLATGIMGRGGARLMFSRVEPLTGTQYLQAEAETKEEIPRRAVVCFAGVTKPLDSRMVAMAMDEVERLRPAPKLVVFAAFQFDPEASKDIDEFIYPGVDILKVQMNTDLMTEDLKKKRSSDQSFWLIGQPDVELVRDKRSKELCKIIVKGFDYYDVKKGQVESGSTNRIAMWMLDTDYDGMCIVPNQVFFPMSGSKDGWNKLAKTLRAEIDQDKIAQYAGCESLWFRAKANSRIAVKIIDDRGIESLKVIRVGDDA
ncbi:MAG: site-specific DNA-methyltransferase [Clostridia bacterium]|nr:site-specific DNA-methyltransferase [Clostridia bacterium]